MVSVFISLCPRRAGGQAFSAVFIISKCFRGQIASALEHSGEGPFSIFTAVENQIIYNFIDRSYIMHTILKGDGFCCSRV